MFVAICIAEVSIPESGSLKDKRRVVRSLKDQIRRDFNVSIAEVEKNEIHSLAVLGITSVCNDPLYLEGQIKHLEEKIDLLSGGMLAWFEHTIERHEPREDWTAG
ncbi:MAG TPA: DUF503 domain-containing protein [Spirochaetota bacterium]|nr:DUF503 domain-containing protein [Spirochaetota bacterium]HPH02152.1 DUF503 domain-containing protein [Spirochaetota bacterium]HPN81788.1 DUF503 domain-containing protein [Spirochaetota bacterium]